ncbi:PHB depolymerase family esterase [uncultured Hymenobacter sp.]|uniref:extracellular catalytic domain type 1 short-chain-length polyhydroxyalkanoate depolymerase n=1 Tax=uncultured Hymenobacter sp. TaxID=170016 RepID=UPI0035C9D072
MNPFRPTLTRSLLLLALLLPAALRAQTAPTGTTVTGTIQSGGLTREYRLYVPAAYRAGTPVPLLFNLHGFGSNSVEQEAYGDFRTIADTANFLVVHPNGALNILGVRSWNVVSTTGLSVADDVAFLAALLTDIQSKYTIDANRVYSTGMSNGGFMSYELACKLSGRIAAVASVAGSMAPDRLQTPALCTPQHPTPVLEIHGVADSTVRYNGGRAFGIFPTAPIPAVLNYWVQFNGCGPTPLVTTLPNPSATDNSTVERSVWGGGRQGSVVQHLRIIGGGHTWPGTAFSQGGSGATNFDISASVEVWRFLRPFRLSGLLGLATRPAADPALGLTAAPNPAGEDGQVLLRASRPLRPAQISLRDALGRPLPGRATAGLNGAVQLNMRNLPGGVYVLQVEQGGHRYQQKLVR